MILEALGSAAIGLVLAHGATRRFPGRLPDRRLVLATGPVAALLGGLISRTVLGSGHTPVALACALGVSAALLSLLLKDETPARRQWRRDPMRATPAPRGSASLRQPGRARPSASYGPP
ncbi:MULTISPECIES: hypothetical protein [unclassified Streptomyces]|uniref:hypothetical protein n=1 Tax=unclassified Streptomyces TaxID=2593676 RepID=UPI002DD861A5|nr:MULTISPECIES: hypothetical protein [unclassified Streptomyces]WSA92510.1 hypothetical protein OIE63_13780 [Streptomyces sp. NBC_01795]WSB76877.1 hypothetical protein OHB04_14585 [Streptomyces sp. NBC_01775]WSS14849.1 hypothetical protein OG533_25360 [Streptomyces sp. NBC_01186]WSS43684.1 hypothetical protein OG220_26125 [Streptomyces sp. NBC_01187]